MGAGGPSDAEGTTVTPAPAVGAGTATDPLAGVPLPSVTGTTSSLAVTGAASASPGIYSTISVTGHGSLSLAPGTYVVTGSVSLSGSAKITGTGVTLYLACTSYPTPCATGSHGASMTIGGSATTTLDKGAIGPGQGIAVFADPNNAATLSVGSHGSLQLTGSLYAASGTLSDSGKANVSVSSGVVDVDRLLASNSAVNSVDSSSPITTTYTYDAASDLTGFESLTTTASYAYNGDGLETDRTIDGVTSHLVWASASDPALLLSDGTNDYVYGPSGTPLEQISPSGAVAYFHQDGLGSTRLLTNSSGAVVGTASYDAYGNLTSRTGITTPLGYTGAYTDSATGLIYLQNRYYDPATDQFLTVDPALALTGAPYAYANDDPTDATDPDGLQTLYGGVVISKTDPQEPAVCPSNAIGLTGFIPPVPDLFLVHWSNVRWKGLLYNPATHRNQVATARISTIGFGPQIGLSSPPITLPGHKPQVQGTLYGPSNTTLDSLTGLSWWKDWTTGPLWNQSTHEKVTSWSTVQSVNGRGTTSTPVHPVVQSWGKGLQWGIGVSWSWMSAVQYGQR